MAGIVVTKIIRETHPIKMSKSGVGPSIGEMVDRHIESAMRDGHELNEVKVEFDQDDWNTLVESSHLSRSA